MRIANSILDVIEAERGEPDFRLLQVLMGQVVALRGVVRATGKTATLPTPILLLATALDTFMETAVGRPMPDSLRLGTH